MTIKELLGFLHDASDMDHIVEKFDEMLSTSKGMFSLATSAMFAEGAGIEEIKTRVRNMDQRLNALQQIIRRDIITHVAVQGVSKVVPCLVMMSITKDAERTGDYAKNIVELAECCSNFEEDPACDYLVDSRNKILSIFDNTLLSFQKSDKKLADKTKDEAHSYMSKYDNIIWGLAAESTGRTAVACALLARFFKRVTAHLGNICTAVTMPLDKIDYHEKDM
jgi:phosphate uptake regulator